MKKIKLAFTEPPTLITKVNVAVLHANLSYITPLWFRFCSVNKYTVMQHSHNR